MTKSSLKQNIALSITVLLLLAFSNAQARVSASGKIIDITPTKVGNQLMITVTAKNNASKYVAGADQGEFKYRIVLLSQLRNSNIFCFGSADESKWVTLKREQMGTFKVDTKGSCWDVGDFGNLFMIALVVDGPEGEQEVDRVAAKIPN